MEPIPSFAQSAKGTRRRGFAGGRLRQKRREIFRLRVPNGNRTPAISGSARNLDTTLRMTAGRRGRDFGAGFSANIRDVALLVNINHDGDDQAAAVHEEMIEED